MPFKQRSESSDEYPVSIIKKKYSPKESLARIQRYSAYQERSHKEVKNKLFEYGLYSTQVDEIISQLITDGFLNEERFAKAYAGGKFRIKKWGRIKIKHELKALGLTKNCIQRGLNEIESSDYSKTLKALIKKKATESRETNPFKKRDKIARFVIGKGYEAELVWEYVRDILSD
jgi:regulatory protein